MQRLPLILIVLAILFSSYASADTLVVATKPTEPFVIKNNDGSYTGISITLWRQMAEQLQLPYRFVEADLEEMVDGLEAGSYDAVVAALTITADRETRFDFTHPFFNTGLGVAVSAQDTGGLLATVGKLFSTEFMQAVGALLLVLLLVGIIAWLVERKANPEEFGGSPWHGIGAGFWWSAVTMTTVGYGDKAPRTFLGRLLGLIWMFAAIIIISGFTAAIASALTVSSLESRISDLDDLRHVRVATIETSAAGAFLRDEGIGFRNIASIEDGLDQLHEGRLDAVVYDAPILQYLIKNEHSSVLRLLPRIFGSQDYGIGLPAGDTLRESMNRALLEVTNSLEWNRTLTKYLGE